ncbi:DUF6193 family natural product biosynthesis protein [Streptacidiphilus jiangxiensis]|uniref:Uncharacterized protein n=1 Tax=Streptacidiphilus jiangxiensis TaxID=235985 RepID=A0A1H7PCV1_STRJI|nr:DUF6193 family natural product biosynthesis protein [Streptacidiphilus jiangxiensis]SEL32897.1 hypothetical protein SAMN05414137_107298 [Streptacidiphilus jiangxiensis]
MSREPDPAVLYPDVAAHGSLAAALQAEAAAQHMSLPLAVTSSDPLRHAKITSVVPHRHSAYIAAWHHERKWSFWGSSNDRLMICGGTKNLRDLPQVIRGWAEGASLEEIGQAATFDLLTGRFEVPDNNPADVIASEWQWLLKDADHAEWPQYWDLIEAAHAERQLRRLYPFTSHWALSFSNTPDFPFSPSFVSIDSPRGAGDYIIREWWNGPALHQVTTAAEAIAIAVGRVPADLLHASSRHPAQDS